MAQPIIESKASDLAIVIITVMFFAIFVVGFASVCYRWTAHQFQSLGSLSTTYSSARFRTVSDRRNMVARGIDTAIINSFPTFLYSEVKERRIGKGGVECAVCLCEFEDNETLRLMPNCCHVFHADCVSVWLSDHYTCPLCRVVLDLQPDESISDLDPERRVEDSRDAHFLDGVTWTNRNRLVQSSSMRLAHRRVSKILFSRSHSTGHSVVQSVENFDRFKLLLPEDVQRQLTKKTFDRVALAQGRRSRRGYRSRSVGSERGIFSYERSRRLQSMAFFFSHRFNDFATSPDLAPLEVGQRSLEIRMA